MRNFGFRALAGVLAAGAISTVALAADMPAPPVLRGPPPPPPPVTEDFGGWYLRGDVGIAATRLGDFSHDVPQWGNFRLHQKTAETTSTVGVGVGYSFGFVRVDATVEHRASSRLNALASAAGGFQNEMGANLTSTVGLLNAYVDLGTWWCITPYIGAGIGGTYNSLSAIRDTDIGNGANGWARDKSTTGLAWAIHAGLAYDISRNLKLDMGYRYLNLGKASTGDILDINGAPGQFVAGMHFKNIASHDFRLGLRWQFADCAGCAPAPVPVGIPVVRKY